ncbi:hypothetical protein [Polymorphobacter fuscus]|uniref:hypothetical protein n=1 Tax=Sandarakinorhabdus fusca TaxID=1439888 RepID=UPI001A9C8BB6|nr:hypothetical protein [Polymorphobacter fuscus]
MSLDLREPMIAASDGRPSSRAAARASAACAIPQLFPKRIIHDLRDASSISIPGRNGQ